MKQYLLTVVEPSQGSRPTPDELQKIIEDVTAVDQEMRDKGIWVFSGGLHEPSTATTLRPQDGEVLATDGPFAEGKEHVGGFSIIEAADLDEALGWGRRLSVATPPPPRGAPIPGGP